VNFGRWPLDYVTLWLSLFLYIILHPWNLLVPMKHQPALVPSKFHLFPTSFQVHQFYHLRYHSHSLHFPVYRKHTQITRHTVLSLPKFSQLTSSPGPTGPWGRYANRYRYRSRCSKYRKNTEYRRKNTEKTMGSMQMSMCKLNSHTVLFCKTARCGVVVM